MNEPLPEEQQNSLEESPEVVVPVDRPLRIQGQVAKHLFLYTHHTSGVERL